MAELGITHFRGLRDDQGRKFIPPENFFRIQNFNFDDIVGANKVLSPFEVLDQGIAASQDGIIEFRYLDQNSQSVIESINVVNGSIFKDWINGSPVLLKSGLEPGKVSFTTLNDELFIVNGLNFPQVYDGIAVYEMGAPRVQITGVGVLTGTYFYEMTYTTTGGEERIGSVSNTVTLSTNSVTLKLPIGYTGTLSRKIYRTEAGGSTPKLLTTIADNTTLTFIDNLPDGSLGADIIAINNELPKPKFIETSFQRLIGGAVPKFPTQIFVSSTNVKVWDTASDGAEVSGIAGDNTGVVGLEIDYSRIIIGTERNIFVADVAGTTTEITRSRANVGVKEGFSMFKVPDNDYISNTGQRVHFPGGVMFVSTLNDIRVFNGNFAQPIATSLDNLKTENWGQPIRGSLEDDLKSFSNIHAYFFDYKYHLIIDTKFYVFDIRTLGWSIYEFLTENNSLYPNVLGEFGERLYVGVRDDAIIEEMYVDPLYRGEEVFSFFETPDLMADDKFKYFKDLILYFVSSNRNKLKVTINVESNYNNPIEQTIEMGIGSFDNQDFNNLDFEVAENNEDYRTVHINQYGRWINFRIENEDGPIFFRGFKLVADEITNKED